jgi:hypothetical protein
VYATLLPIETSSTPPGNFHASVVAVRKNLAPILVIQAVAVVIIVAYFNHQGVREWTEGIQDAKVRGGYPFAFVVGMIAGGVFPELARLLSGKVRRYDRAHLIHVLWSGFVFGIVGLEVDAFYQLLAFWFGGGTDVRTLMTKVTLDMGLFSPLLCIPTATLLVGWWQAGFGGAYWRRAFTLDYFKKEVWNVMPMCWSYWIPILICCYALPLNLQFPFAMLAESAWSVVFVFFVSERPAPI